MSLALSKAANLKPDLRLAQAISEFEAELSSQEKARFHACRDRSLSRREPPETRDVMQLTAEIDSLSSRSSRGRRCFGPRFTNVLHAIQQFTTVGDVMVGGTQNILACGVWSLVRMTLLTLVNFSTYFENLSELLMKIGRTAPRHERLKLLFPRSKSLQSHLTEYFILVVRLCHHFLTMTKRSTLGQLATFSSESTLKPIQLELEQWARLINEEVLLLMAEETQVQSSRLKSLMKSSEAEAHRQRAGAYVRVLDACSMYDYETTWKETRKLGTANWYRQVQEYQNWKTGIGSCFLLCRGKLGSGKSVILANVVDDLHLHPVKVPVAYFFCRHDIFDSLSARTIVGSLVRQLLCPIADLTNVENLISPRTTLVGFETFLKILRGSFPSDFQAFFVLDGLDECSPSQRFEVVHQLKQLQKVLSLRICLSFRSDVDNRLLLKPDLDTKIDVMTIPDNNPDITGFIKSELYNCIDSERLVLGDPELILEIQDTLNAGAQGMFLWVALQLESLCAAKTDKAIRDTLADLPKDLPETFSRILKKSAAGDAAKTYQTCTLELVIAANRPLTTGELREALSVTPGNDVWDPSRLINNVFSALSYCGSVITVDEENSTVKLIHHSVKQFLLGSGHGSNSNGITVETANRTMRAIILTYLNYNVFETRISTTVASSIPVGNAPYKIIQAMDSSKRTRAAVLRLMKTRNQVNSDIGRVIAQTTKQPRPRHEDEFLFHPYAKFFWLDHAWSISEQETATYAMLYKLIDRKLGSVSATDEESQRIFFWAAGQGHPAIIRLCCKYGADTQVKDKKLGTTPLFWAASNGREEVVQILAAQFNADLEFEDANGRTPLSYAAGLGFAGTVAILIDHGADMETLDHQACTPMYWAARGGHVEVVKTLISKGATVDNNFPHLYQTPLLCAVENKRADVVELLLQHGADPERKIYDFSALARAAQYDDAASLNIIRSLLDHGADIETRHQNGQTPLHFAAAGGMEKVFNLLLEKGADIMNLDDSGNSPLSSTAGFATIDTNGDEMERGQLSIIRTLIEKGADIESRDKLGRTPLFHAAQAKQKGATIKMLIEHGANRNVFDGKGETVFYDLVTYFPNEEKLKTLLDNGFDIEMWNAEGQTPLWLAAKHGKLSIVRMLLDHGADTRSHSPVHGMPVTAGIQHPDIADLLKEADDRLYPAEMISRSSSSRSLKSFMI
jgi:ankyrin repeat protein